MNNSAEPPRVATDDCHYFHPEGNNPRDFNVVTIDLNPDGSTTPTTYPDVGGSSDAMVSPEPATFLLLGSALALGFVHRKR